MKKRLMLLQLDRISFWSEGTGKACVTAVPTMQGETVTIKDIVLELHEIEILSNLLCGEESLSSDSEEEHQVFKIDTRCDNCKTGISVCVRSSNPGIRHLQILLNQELSFLCPGCSRNLFQHGRYQ